MIPAYLEVGYDPTLGRVGIQSWACPSCSRLVLRLMRRNGEQSLIFPRGHGRPPLADSVPAAFASDYNEAVLVLADSPKASAALSRRCLQHVLREKAGVKHGTLASEIDAVIDSLPAYIADSLHSVRHIGNLAAHPTKEHASGEIVDVEPGEAEWLLEALESLFDHYFVKPAEAEARRNALKQKLDSTRAPKE
ncbi:MAG TPA: DUF4145 domain-containing protein [Polyangiaceae bacterium]|nr:DUF4145 domain-containing protein [Polyangiaceae bacterium]